MTTREQQLNIRLDPQLDHWLEHAAGGRDRRADYVRKLIQKAMRRDQEEAEIAMFNRAAAELTADDLEEREDLLSAFSNRDS
jgi:hypothetical protein